MLAPMSLVAGVSAPIAFGSESDLRVWLAEWVAAQGGQPGDLTYESASVDLNADGVDEEIIFLEGPYWCGSGGCNALVLQTNGMGYDLVGQFSVTNVPIGLLATVSHGWRDLFVHVGGGGMPAGVVAMRFDGTAYPSNPTVDGDPLDAGFKGKVLIADD